MVAESLMVCGFLTSPLPLSRAASTSQAQAQAPHVTRASLRRSRLRVSLGLGYLRATT